MSRSYSYCPHCSEGMPKASIHEVLADIQICHHCGVSSPPNQTKDEILLDLIDRVEQLEARNDP